jgi:hypothetical protein
MSSSDYLLSSLGTLFILILAPLIISLLSLTFYKSERQNRFGGFLVLKLVFIFPLFFYYPVIFSTNFLTTGMGKLVVNGIMFFPVIWNVTFIYLFRDIFSSPKQWKSWLLVVVDLVYWLNFYLTAFLPSSDYFTNVFQIIFIGSTLFYPTLFSILAIIFMRRTELGIGN